MRLVLILLLASAVLVPTRAHAADVHGDDAGDRYVGTGGVILPGTVASSERQSAATCDDCAWRMSSPCVASVLGNAFGDACGSVVRGCPGGELLRAWRREGAAPWRELGLVCLRGGGPVTVAQAARAAREEVAHRVPALAPAAEPVRGVLVQLPTAFASGQPAGGRQWRASVAGAVLEVSAQPAWRWEFGDGGELLTHEPGGRHPSAVTHVYRRSGPMRVTVTTEWSATFTVDGLGPFPVVEPVRQVARLAVEVGEGRALLTPGDVGPSGMTQ